jgi:hypothetical protein
MHALTRAGVVVDESIGVNIVERIALGQDGKRDAPLVRSGPAIAQERAFCRRQTAGGR